MALQKAIVVQAPHKAALVTDRPIPALRDDYIAVKPIAVALNPTDWKHVDFIAPPDTVVGCDYAGIVEEVGSGVKKPFRKGDRICGVAHAFAEHIVVKGDVQIRVPENLSWEEASTLGVSLTTVGQALYQSLKLAWPTTPLDHPVPILVYGGSTATGTLAIQFAKLSGYYVYTTCSPHSMDLVRSRGADAVFDYHDPGAAAAIRKQTQNELRVVFDTISLESSAAFCEQAMSTEGGSYGNTLFVKMRRANVQSRSTLAYTITGEEIQMGNTTVPAREGDKAFAEAFFALAEELLARGQIQPHPQRVGTDGLGGVLDGLEDLRRGEVHGEKLVYRVGETP